MEGFTVILRDVMVVLASAALMLASVFGALVVWQVYRLARELRAEVQPILASVQETTETVRDTTAFVGRRMSSRMSALVSLGASARGAYRLVGQFYGDLRRDAPAGAPAAGSAAPRPPAPPASARPARGAGAEGEV